MRSSQQETRTRTRDLEPDWDLEYIVACHCHFLVPDITITLQVSFCLSLRIFNISMCWSVFSVLLTNSFIDHSSSCIYLRYRISSTLLERIVGRGRQWCPASSPPHWSYFYSFLSFSLFPFTLRSLNFHPVTLHPCFTWPDTISRSTGKEHSFTAPTYLSFNLRRHRITTRLHSLLCAGTILSSEPVFESHLLNSI